MVRDVGDLPARTTITHDLYVYPDNMAARRALAAVRRNPAACAGYPGAAVTRQTSPSWGEEAVAATIAKPADGAGERTGTPLRLVAVRVGPAVAVFHGFPQIPQIDQNAQAAVARLCPYGSTCRPRPGLPAPLAALSDGGPAWVAVVAVFDPADRSARPGIALAAAAELGYHAAIVPVACDQDAAAALGLSSAGARYVAVYFGTDTDASAFAAAVAGPTVRTLAVQTRCVAG